MNDRFPHAAIVDDLLTVHFSGAAPLKSVGVMCTVDLTDFGDVIGIEVLDWHRQLSDKLFDTLPSTSEEARWSYDREIDALYIHLKTGRSQIQKNVVANVLLDSHLRVAQLEISVASVT